ncbi:MAG TPA: DinB family protein [Coriobacteriia bacterium]|nr:DinB family protein [Coriobacteriia bacterium]
MTDARRSPTQLVADYRRGAVVLRDALAGLDAASLQARPIAGKLSSMEVACHIVDSDQFMCDRMKRTIATDRPVLMGVESVDYVGALRYHDRDLELDLRLLEVQREQMAADLDRLAENAWGRSAMHSENGEQSLVDLLEHAVEHLEDHVQRIYEKRSALGL